ncbi:flavin-binding monooxygenase [Colletotrichum truncatum]|uniref:Flavin-binding monooxygenase n=1 Tax=Colletotrichum truncatum TaxID=5467 RepID=A0ACC3ZLL9_COLTU|nr:flavin-binding monooxygenase [Colletotrichum truncatum]KAF6783997.1 flavin-binding monooxygenase [Colletotrichum truncatum]
MDPTIYSSVEDAFDVIIIGAGISGINTAYYLQSQGPQNASYAILEGRGDIGGTWDLFRYPGIRSDSDIYTFGFSWNPWKGDNPLASGPAIKSYLHESISTQGIDKNIRFHHQVTSADWKSTENLWRLQATVGGEKTKTFKARFIVLGTGYYDYEQPLASQIPGIETFSGPVVHPQFWPKDLDYRNKNVVIVGSGATAVTLLPNIATDAQSTTILQRSPTYIIGLPKRKGLLSRLMASALPKGISSRILRLQYMLMGYLFYYYCVLFPRSARRVLLGRAAKELPPSIPVDPNFRPRYNPWQQRLCVCPDADFFAALRSGKADIVTDIIDNVTNEHIFLKSGKTLKPDIIITATGLRIRFGGAISISVDGVHIDPNLKFGFKGCMLQDVPNLAYVFGYANASWTLGAEATGTYLVRLWRDMKLQGVTSVTPYIKSAEGMKSRPIMNLTSTYVKHAAKVFPKAGDGLWAPRRLYMLDLWQAMVGKPFEGLKVAYKSKS